MSTQTQQAAVEQDDAPRPWAGYAPGEDRPLVPYLGIMSAYGGLFGGALYTLHRRGHDLPETVGAGDIALIALATQKLARVIAKDKITSPFRAPFTKFEDTAGHGELSEEPRGRGWRKALGELVACPYCLGTWITGSFTLGLVAAPRPTRLVATLFATQAIADGIQIAYSAGKESY
jgi:hypothetical protein